MNMILDAYYLPEDVPVASFEEKQIQRGRRVVTLRYPRLDPQTVSATVRHLQQKGRPLLLSMTTEEIVSEIDRAVHDWLEPNGPYQRLLEEWLPAVTGYDAEWTGPAFRRFLRTQRKKELLRLLYEELGTPRVMDDFIPRTGGGFSRAYGPSLTFHFFSGNVPGPSLQGVILSLLVKSPLFGKTSFAEPLTAAFFAQTLARKSPALAAALAVLPWSGGELSLEQEIIKESEAVVVTGSNETVEAIRRRVPADKRFLQHGHRVSLALVGKEALTPSAAENIARRIAREASLYDQQSCLAPQTVFVEEGGRFTPRMFARLLAHALDEEEKLHPRGPMTENEMLRLHAVRANYAFQNETETYTGRGKRSWTVFYHDRIGYARSPLFRTVHLFSCSRLEAAIAVLRNERPFLQTAGVAVKPQRLFSLAGQLGEAGISRMCAIENMSSPRAAWHHDGKYHLLERVRWIDIEPEAERAAEQYDPNRD